MKEIVAFLQGRIMGRTLQTDELTYSLEDGALEGVYADQMTFANLKSAPSALEFDLFVVAREKLYAMDEEHNRGELRKDFSCASLFHYQLAKRKSTGQITGYMRFVSASQDDVPAEAMASTVFGFRLDGKALLWEEREILYRDMPGTGDSHRPVAFEARCRLFGEDGKASYEYDGRCLDVNPDDFQRSPSTAVYPKFVARER